MAQHTTSVFFAHLDDADLAANDVASIRGAIVGEKERSAGASGSSAADKGQLLMSRSIKYEFQVHTHPFAGTLTKRFLVSGLDGLQAADTLEDSETLERTAISSTGHPYTSEDSVVPRELKEQLDFNLATPYGGFNWELFFHAPFTLAVNLSKNQRYDEAQKWFHYIFDPTDDSASNDATRFWKFREFRTATIQSAEELVVALCSTPGSTSSDNDLRRSVVDSLNAWRDAPYRPHVVARYRPWAYMYKTVMAYLDNLIAWGDSLFMEDTRESINEAMQLYVLAANILGPRPLRVPRKGTVQSSSYSTLKNNGFSEFNDVLVGFQADLGFDFLPPAGKSSEGGTSATNNVIRALYFCIPGNERLLNYWDTVGDRLHKIRNSLNLQGAFRQLPLFEPPIDPALLARATAAGLDVAAMLRGDNVPMPLVRFQVLIQKANELCQEIKSLGAGLLSAIEKEDNEAIALLRAKHERVMLNVTESVRYAQWQEARKTLEALRKSRDAVVQRYVFYERQLGKKQADIVNGIPQLDALEKLRLFACDFQQTEADMQMRELEVNIAEGVSASAVGKLNGGKVLSSHEVRELAFMEAGQGLSELAAVMGGLAATAHLIPDTGGEAQPMGVGFSLNFGGKHLGASIATRQTIAQVGASRLAYEAQRAGRINSFARRELEWSFQSNQAAAELNQLTRQLRAAEIREAIAEKEWRNHQQQMKHAEDIELFLSGEKNTSDHLKVSTQGLYAWMKRETRGLYSQCFELAFDVAKKAERALRFELGSPALSFINYDYMKGREGLLAGERLYQDLKRMEMAFLNNRSHEFEIVKHVSLASLGSMVVEDNNPLWVATKQAKAALDSLKGSTSSCSFILPDALFDRDFPGQFFRRIKSVSISVPCVAGPYSGVNGVLRLLRNKLKTSAQSSDDTYIAQHVPVEAIATSSGQNDGGRFELNFHDDKYLPFEGAGVDSTWEFKLSGETQIKESISDVVLHIRYTARGGA